MPRQSHQVLTRWGFVTVIAGRSFEVVVVVVGASSSWQLGIGLWASLRPPSGLVSEHREQGSINLHVYIVKVLYSTHWA